MAPIFALRALPFSLETVYRCQLANVEVVWPRVTRSGILTAAHTAAALSRLWDF